MKYTLGFSPCPNDCFIFDAMIHGKIDTEGLEFEPVITDVEDLNQRAFDFELDITKLSFHVYNYVSGDYILLHSGSALGNNCGPLLISKNNYSGAIPSIDDFKIAIPGRYTTANLLLGMYAPKANNKVEMIFSAIEDSVLNGAVDAGVIIHENRFTYQSKGLHKIVDLGEFYEEKYKHPIPLGGIVVKRNFDNDLQQKVNRIIRRSVEFAFANPESSMDFIKSNSQEMDEEVMRKHIELYVNNYSIDLGEAGKNAVTTLFDEAYKQGIIPNKIESLFIKL